MKHWDNKDAALEPSLTAVSLEWGIQIANRMLKERSSDSGGIDPDARMLFTIAVASLNEVSRLEGRVAELEKSIQALETKLFGDRWSSRAG